MNDTEQEREAALKIFKHPTKSDGKIDQSKCSQPKIYPKDTRFAFCVSEDVNPGASYVVAYLKQQGYEVELFFDPKQGDRGYQRNTFIKRLFNLESWLIKEMKAYKPDVVCFSVLSATYQWGVRFAEIVKKEVKTREGKDVHVVFGGTMPTLVPEIVAENSFIDEVIQGDGVKHFGGKFDPDNLWPERDMFFAELPPEHRHTQLFMTSYGCPFRCNFCNNEQLAKVGQYVKLKRTVEGCIKELKFMKDKYGLKNVLFVDDILTLDKKWLMEFLPQYREHINVPFACFGHVNCLDEEQVAEMAKSKCQTLWFGVQSGCEFHRKHILDRPETNEQILKVAGYVKKYGIKLMIDHICGLPYESDLTHEISAALYMMMKPDVINVYECLYFPKAGINDQALKCGYLVPEDIPKINRGQHVVYQQGNKGGEYFNKYAKSLVAIPLKAAAWEFLPMSLIKLVIHLRAGRGYIASSMIQNEFYFTARAILKKLGIMRHPANVRKSKVLNSK